ncbi:hypothetical protein [Paenibacillus sp. QZ-Y1]|uniref:hypothetical protein n=1 Tax=Paenibacillus sp. QZ-Y1 TaxID=3414511 RepID=UPI003F79E5A1
MDNITEEIEQYKRYDLNDHYRDTHLHVNDAEKICEFIQGMARYIDKLELRINELEERAASK